MNSIALLCPECWQHISEFHSFRQKILMLQEDLIENDNQIISQLPCNSLSSNLEEYFCAVEAHPADQVQSECKIKLEPIPDADVKTSQNQQSSSSGQLTQTESAKHVTVHLLPPDDIISGDNEKSMTQEDTTIKIEKELFDMYDVDYIIFKDDEQHAITKEDISIDIKDELFEICDADDIVIDDNTNAITQKETSIKVKDELFDICDKDEIIYKEDENSMTLEDRSIKIREDMFDICDEIKPEEEDILEMSTEQFITDKEIIPEDEHFEIKTTEKQCNSHKTDNNNRFVEIGNIRTSVQKISSIKPTIRRDVISTNCQNSSDNSDDSNQDDEENAPTRKTKNTFSSAMVDATIARWKPELDCDICSEKLAYIVKLNHTIEGDIRKANFPFHAVVAY